MTTDLNPFESAVLKVILDLGSGEVATYGEVAELAGHPGRARAVGRFLRNTEDDVPWWRVVGHGGRLVSPSPLEQADRLRREGHRLAGPTGPIRFPKAEQPATIEQTGKSDLGAKSLHMKLK